MNLEANRTLDPLAIYSGIKVGELGFHPIEFPIKISSIILHEFIHGQDRLQVF